VTPGIWPSCPPAASPPMTPWSRRWRRRAWRWTWMVGKFRLAAGAPTADAGTPQRQGAPPPPSAVRSRGPANEWLEIFTWQPAARSGRRAHPVMTTLVFGCSLYCPGGGTTRSPSGDACGNNGRFAGRSGRSQDGRGCTVLSPPTNPGEQPLRSALDRGIGDGGSCHGAFPQHPGIDEFARPERVIGIGKHRLEPDSKPLPVDGVVDQQQCAGA